MAFKDHLEKLRKEVTSNTPTPEMSYANYFSQNYDNMNEVVRLIAQSNSGLEKTQIRELAYKKIADIAFEDGIKTSHGNKMTVKQVGFLLSQVYRERVAVKQGKQPQTPQPANDNALLNDEQLSKLTKESIGWTKEKFETIASRYFHEHVAYWPFDKQLQLVVAWLLDDSPNIADPQSPEREKGDSGWSYGDFWDEYQKAKELRDF